MSPRFAQRPPQKPQTKPHHTTPRPHNNTNSVPEGARLLTRITSLVNDATRPLRQGPGDQEPDLTEQQVVALVDLGASPGGATGRHWVLDPIDGTRGFVGGRQYAVCLALLEEGQLAVGALGCPNLPHGRAVTDADGGEGAMRAPGAGALFACARGAGAWSADLWDEGAALGRVRVDDAAPVADARVMESFESRHSDHPFAERVRASAGIAAPPLRLDSQAKYGLLSRGDAAVFMRFPPASYREKIWDHAAGALMVAEAGGVVSDAAGQPLDFSLGRWLDGMVGGIVAAPPKVHAAVLAAIAEAGKAGGGGYGFTDGGAGVKEGA
jgi:3'(2'), 5'-bisphosphate nucleotidase/inositol polyphosphate 1-phosphatase